MPQSNKYPDFKLTRHHFIKGQEQLSKEDIQVNTISISPIVRTYTNSTQRGEAEACQTVQMAVVGGILLYLCMSNS